MTTDPQADAKLTQQQLAQAERHFRSGQLQPAEAMLKQVIERSPATARAFELLAYIRGNQGRIDDCESLLAQATALPGCAPEVFFYLGRVRLQLGRAREAVEAFERCIDLAGEHFESLHELGVACNALGDDAKALAVFKRAERKNPRSPEVHANLGDTLSALRRLPEALVHYERALALEPRFAHAWSGRGDVLAQLQRRQDALDSYAQALKFAPDDAAGWMGRATTLMLMDRHADALAACDKVAQLAPDTDYLAGTRLLAGMYMARWSGWNDDVRALVARVDAGQKAAPPFSLIVTPADGPTLLRAARTFAADRCPAVAAVEFETRPPGRRLRIGYFSSDFREHATAQLMARLFECHDRTRFECLGFAIGTHAPDAMTARLAAAFDGFEQVGAFDDAAIAARARALQIDIAVDLNGHVAGGRPGIFAHRAAPLQVNYLGFPGSMGCDFIDYIVADDTLVPPAHYPHFSEKVVSLSGSYQVNDDTKRIGDDPGTRQGHGLPAEGFVFASFNNLYKLTPPLFDVWMRLLSAVPGSVLWLLAGRLDAERNLRAAAVAHGIAADRLVFAQRVPLPQHLARHVHADLFLDSFHCCAHTTCSDALWAGLPLLTLAGQTFASRVSASLLNAIGLPELVTHDMAAYEAQALHWARSPEALRDLRSRLAALRTTSSLFDTEGFAHRIEAAYEAMWSRHADGLAPDHLPMATYCRTAPA